MRPLKSLPTSLPLALLYYGPEFCADSFLLAILAAGSIWENWLNEGAK
jgi:hypothetical protein